MIFSLRMVLLGIHFVVAGLLGLLLALVRPLNPDNTRLCARLYSIPALKILGLQLDAQIDELLNSKTSFVIAANHQSNYDLFILGRVMPRRTVTVGKRSLLWVPVFGLLYWLAGNVLINRGNAEQAKRSMLLTTDTLQHKDTSIWIFVEGTRNHGRGLLPFKKGAFLMALKAGVPIIPLCCSTYRRDMRLDRWKAGRVKVRALPALETAGLGTKDLDDLMTRCHRMMSECITELDREVAAEAAALADVADVVQPTRR